MRYLVALWDGGGTSPAELGVVRRLVAAGHDVTVLGDPTLADGPNGARAAGAEFRPWREAPHRSTLDKTGDLFRDWECRTPLGAFARVRDRQITGPALAFAREVQAALDEAPVDAVVASGVLLGALAGAESRGVPSVALSPNIYTRPAPGMPPLGLGLQPAGGPLGRSRDRALNALIGLLWARGLPDLNAARAALGLDPLRDIWEQWDRAARVLVLTATAFDFPARLPANVVYTGPVLDDPAWAEPAAPPPGDDPLVVVGLSSSWMGQVDLLRRVVAALDTLPVRGLVTTGPAVDPADVPGTARIAVVRSASHAVLFRQAAVVVTHAGHSTIIKALAAGVPTLCLPMGRDQADNTVRAARHGAALRLRPSASSERIAAAVRRLLRDPSYRSAAQALGERLRAEAASPVLLAELEAVARGRPRIVRPRPDGDSSPPAEAVRGTD